MARGRFRKNEIRTPQEGQRSHTPTLLFRTLRTGLKRIWHSHSFISKRKTLLNYGKRCGSFTLGVHAATDMTRWTREQRQCLSCACLWDWFRTSFPWACVNQQTDRQGYQTHIAKPGSLFWSLRNFNCIYLAVGIDSDRMLISSNHPCIFS